MGYVNPWPRPQGHLTVIQYTCGLKVDSRYDNSNSYGFLWQYAPVIYRNCIVFKRLKSNIMTNEKMKRCDYLAIPEGNYIYLLLTT